MIRGLGSTQNGKVNTGYMLIPNFDSNICIKKIHGLHFPGQEITLVSLTSTR